MTDRENKAKASSKRTYVVRSAVAEDVEHLRDLATRISDCDPFVVVSDSDLATGAHPRSPSIGEPIGSTSSLWVAQARRGLVGMALCRGFDGPQRAGVVQFELGVDPGFRRRGVGRAMTRAALEWAQSADIHRVQLSVVAENGPARALYEAQGFEYEGTLRRAYRWGEEILDVYLMAKLLR